MKNQLVPTNYFAAREELEEIMEAGARALRQPGLALLPVKRHMLGLPDHEADLILDACNLLFASILSYESSIWEQKHATDAINLVESRIRAGTAEGVTNALFHGPTAHLLLEAMNRAPIAFYAMSQAAPNLHIIDRCKLALSNRA
jgi:hypothetical protein